MTSGNALNTFFPASRGTRVARIGTIGRSSKLSCVACAPAVPGVTCLRSLGTGTVRMSASHAGARRVSGSAWPWQCAMVPTWSTCSSTPPFFAPTSILPVPKKARGQEIGLSRGGLTTKLHVAVDALGKQFRHSLGRTGRRHCTGHRADQGSACGLHRGRQGIRPEFLRRRDHGGRESTRDPATFQPVLSEFVRSASLQRSQSNRALLQSHQASRTHRCAPGQTRQVLPYVHTYGMCFRLTDLTENTPHPGSASDRRGIQCQNIERDSLGQRRRHSAVNCYSSAEECLATPFNGMQAFKPPTAA